MYIREAKTGDEWMIAKVHVDTWLNTYKGLVSDNYLFSLNYHDRAKRWKKIIEKKEHILLVSINDKEEIIGYAYGGINRGTEVLYDGELYAIYLLPNYQKKQVGKKLFHAFVSKLKEKGFSSMIIWVLKGNSAYQFYEKQGGIKQKTKKIEVDGVLYDEISYGWLDLNQILKECY